MVSTVFAPICKDKTQISSVCVGAGSNALRWYLCLKTHDLLRLIEFHEGFIRKHRSLTGHLLTLRVSALRPLPPTPGRGFEAAKQEQLAPVRGPNRGQKRIQIPLIQQGNMRTLPRYLNPLGCSAWAPRPAATSHYHPECCCDTISPPFCFAL